MRWLDLRLQRSRTASGDLVAWLGVPLLDRYLEFVAWVQGGSEHRDLMAQEAGGSAIVADSALVSQLEIRFSVGHEALDDQPLG